MEVTHMTEATKLEKLFAIVTIAFLLSYTWVANCAKQKKRQQPRNEKAPSD